MMRECLINVLPVHTIESVDLVAELPEIQDIFFEAENNPSFGRFYPDEYLPIGSVKYFHTKLPWLLERYIQIVGELRGREDYTWVTDKVDTDEFDLWATAILNQLQLGTQEIGWYPQPEDFKRNMRELING